MTAPTPEQMRELTTKEIRQEDMFAHVLALRVALRSAADQIEARDTFVALQSNGGIR
jgi:hypothetical protein